MMREIPIEKNDDIEFTIDALGSEGQGIGRVDGYTVFVPLALPGEKIRAHVIKTTSGYQDKAGEGRIYPSRQV